MKKYTLPLIFSSILFASEAYSIDIRTYSELDSFSGYGGNFTILNNVDALNSIGPIDLKDSVSTIEGINKSITMTNGDMALNYPLIWLRGNTSLSLKNITFNNIGGFFSYGMNGNNKIELVDNVTFKNSNYASNSSIRGNVFSIYDNIGTIKNSLFEGNNLSSLNGSAYGSSIYIQGNTDSISGTTFLNNSVTSFGSSSRNAAGGSIYNVMAIDDSDNDIPNTGVMNISSSLFEGNKADGNTRALARGGAIYTGAGTVLSISDTNFTNNSAVGTGSLGGAIYANKATVNLNAINQNIVFSGNTASLGGDIYTTSGSQINLNTTSGKTFSFGSSLYSEGKSTINIASNGTLLFNDQISNFDMNITGGIIQLGRLNNNDSTKYLNNVVLDFNGAPNTTSLSSYRGNAGLVGDVQIKNANHIGLYLDVSASGADTYNIIANSDGNFDLRGVNIVSELATDGTYYFDVFTGGYNLPIINSGSPLTVATSGFNLYEISGNNNGQIVVKKTNAVPPPDNNFLNAAINNETKAFSLTDNLAISSNITKLTADFLFNGNQKTLSTTGNNISGFENDAYTLSLVNVKDITGFAKNGTGGAVKNTGSGTLIIRNSNFSNNTTMGSSSDSGLGGAIYNSGSGNSVISGSSFTNNSVTSLSAIMKPFEGGAITNKTSGGGSLSIINSVFKSNYVNRSDSQNYNLGGAISNLDGVLNITSTRFEDNYVSNTYSGGNASGGAINAYGASGTITNINNSYFIGNHASASYQTFGGAISNGFSGRNSIMNISGTTFENNSVTNDNYTSSAGNTGGGAIANLGILTLKDTNFINNRVNGKHTLGGAILNDDRVGALTIIAENSNVIFKGNTANGIENDIYSGYDSKVAFDGSHNIYLNGGIEGKAKITKNGAGALVLSGDNSFKSLSLDEGIILLRNLKSFSGNSFNLGNNTVFSILNDQIDNIDFKDLTLGGVTTMAIDIDLANLKSDIVSADSVLGGIINISKINNISNGVPFYTNAQNLSFSFAEGALKDNIVVSPHKLDISRIYRPYDIVYDNNTGLLSIERGSGYNAIKPSIMAAPTAMIAGNYTNQLNIFNQALDINAYNNCDNAKNTKECNNGVWFKGFTDIERIDLDDGPHGVDNTGFGALLGVDFKGTVFKNGWQEKHSLFLAYSGSKQKYDGVSINQNGATLGMALALSKNNFWNKASVLFGMSRAESGGDYWTSLNTGIAFETGYDIKNSLGVWQPNLTVSYSYLKAFDYDTNYVDINGGDINAVQLKPEIKWLAPESFEYRPFFKTAGVFTFMDGNSFKADTEALPDLSLDPYIEYGGGIETSFNNGVNGYFNILGRSFGRKGVMLNVGVNTSF